MKAYRSRYAELEALGAQIIAVSADSDDTQKRFKDEIGAPFSFVADPDGKLIEAFDVKTPVFTLAKRYTFVIGPGRKLLHVDERRRVAEMGRRWLVFWLEQTVFDRATRAWERIGLRHEVVGTIVSRRFLRRLVFTKMRRYPTP